MMLNKHHQQKEIPTIADACSREYPYHLHKRLQRIIKDLIGGEYHRERKSLPHFCEEQKTQKVWMAKKVPRLDFE